MEVVRDGLERGYLVAGGGSWYTGTLAMLEPGASIWVKVLGSGYVGAGVASGAMQPVDEVTVLDEAGAEVPLVQASKAAATLRPA